MGKTFDPQKHNMVFFSVCNGKGKLPGTPNEFDLAEDVEVFEIFKEVDREQIVKVKQKNGHRTD